MIRSLLNRLALSLVTLWLLSVIVFVGSQVLPGNVGLSILGPFADAEAVANLNHKLGVDRPLLVQYWDWLSRFATGDMGMSLLQGTPVAPEIGKALLNSLFLGAVALALVVPLSIAGGVFAALRHGKPADRVISIVGLSVSVVPEFVSGIVLLMVFGVWLRWFPLMAAAPDGSGLGMQIYHLILPSMPLVLILFGYIARMARAGTVTALEADYTRTAVLKGLPKSVVIWRHVLRNALLPTITIISSQISYLVGGLVVIEVLFRYQGIGSLIYTAARGKDLPMLQSSILVVGIVVTLTTFLADLLYGVLNPRIRLRGAA